MINDYNVSIGQRLAEMRVAQGKSLIEIAATAGIWTSTLSYMEYGMNLTPRNIWVVTRALGVTLDTLVEGLKT